MHYKSAKRALCMHGAKDNTRTVLISRKAGYVFFLNCSNMAALVGSVTVVKLGKHLLCFALSC